MSEYRDAWELDLWARNLRGAWWRRTSGAAGRHLQAALVRLRGDVVKVATDSGETIGRAAGLQAPSGMVRPVPSAGPT